MAWVKNRVNNWLLRRAEAEASHGANSGEIRTGAQGLGSSAAIVTSENRYVRHASFR